MHHTFISYLLDSCFDLFPLKLPQTGLILPNVHQNSIRALAAFFKIQLIPLIITSKDDNYLSILINVTH